MNIGEEQIAKAIQLGIDKRDAEAEVIAAADDFYDLAHAALPELRMVESWKAVSKRLDKAVQELRKVRTRENSLK